MKFSKGDMSQLVSEAKALLVWEEAIKKIITGLNILSIVGVLGMIFWSVARPKDMLLGPLLPAISLGAVILLNLFQGVWIEKISTRRVDLENKSSVDELTGAWTQARFEVLIEEEIRRAGRYHHSLTLCILDLDDFRSINDHLGRTQGDELLKRFARFLRGAIRFMDAMARSGGDEFCVLLPHTDMVGAEKFLARILALSLEQIDCSFSAGVTPYRTGESHQQFLARARMALDHAKREGKKRIRCLIGHDDGYVTVSF